MAKCHLLAEVPIHSDTVWNLSDLAVLHELQTAIAIIVHGLFENPHSPSGLQETAHVVFQNVECVRRFGIPNSAQDMGKAIQDLPLEDRISRHNWLLQITQGKGTQNTYMDVYKLAQPVFNGLGPDLPACEARISSKHIKVQTAPGKVESAIMHVIDMEASNADKRFTSMIRQTPLHTFMFNRHGRLLVANDSAMEACLHSAAGLKVPDPQNITVKSLFDLGAYEGGEEEALASYDEAMQAIFGLQLDRYSHVQPHRNPETGKLRWECIEMWPMKDPLDSNPAVLVKRFNVTQQKELEMQLSIQKEALQRKNQEMEQDSAALQQDKQRLEGQAAELAQRLDAVVHDRFKHQSAGFDAETPIDKTLNMLHSIIAGKVPQVEAAMDLYHILSESDTYLRQPVALESQLLADDDMDDDVGRSMLQLLQGNRSRRASKDPLKRSVSKAAGLGTFVGQRLSTQDSLANYVLQNVTPAIERMLQDADKNWQFDIFGFAEECKGKSLSLLGFHLYKQGGLIREFNLDEGKLVNFLQKVESGYASANPYHNSIHATSVLQMTHMLLHHGGVLRSGALSKAQYMSSYWSAITHDYEHGGVNNDFLIKTADPLAIRYNDQSPLENHHCAAAAGLLFQEQYQYIQFAALKGETIMQVRICCINQVLGTDMKKHFDITSRFQAAFKRPAASSLNSAAAEEALEWDKVKPEDKTLAHQMLVKCADIGHLAAAPRTHKRWATQLEEEFFRQGDREKEAGLGVSPLMDRSMKGGMTRSQLGFFQIVGIPLFRAMADLFPDAQSMLDGVLANFRHWELGTAMEDLPP